MSECVVRMEMPRNCYNCDLRYECNAFYAPGKPKPFMKGCQIICQLPEGHGRLVDADDLERYWLSRIALMDSCAGKGGILESVERSTLRSCIEDIGDSKTIVPAEAERSET